MNSRTTLSRTTILWSGMAILIVAGVITLVYSFGGGQKDAVTEVNAIYTNAALTLASQQQTLRAGVQSATPSITALISPTASVTPLVSPTLSNQPLTLPTNTSAAVSTCDNSIYVNDVTIPDNTAVNPGQSFTKTWRIANNGTCTWSPTYQIIFITGDSMSGKSTAIGQAVAPGQTADISVALVAPTTNGTATGTWRLYNDKSQTFGQAVTVVIKVGATTTGTVSITPTKTAVGGATSTPTPTPTSTTSAPANTATPTSTPTSLPPTATPTPTDTPIPTST